MKPVEVTHYATLIADLIVTGIRCRENVAQLAEVRVELADTIEQALTLLAHDARPEPATFEQSLVLLREAGQWSVKTT